MAQWIHGVQYDFFPGHPSVEHLRHVGLNLPQPLCLCFRQFFFGTFVVEPVELINDVVTNGFEDLPSSTPGIFDMLFKPARIIMDEEVWLYLLNLHSTHDHLELVLVDSFTMCSMAATTCLE